MSMVRVLKFASLHIGTYCPEVTHGYGESDSQRSRSIEARSPRIARCHHGQDKNEGDDEFNEQSDQIVVSQRGWRSGQSKLSVHTAWRGKLQQPSADNGTGTLSHYVEDGPEREQYHQKEHDSSSSRHLTRWTHILKARSMMLNGYIEANQPNDTRVADWGI